MEKKCIICGTDQKLSRHHVVPYSFVKHMVKAIAVKIDSKENKVTLCDPCHRDYEKRANSKRAELSKRYVVPLGGKESKNLKKLKKAVSAANTLLRPRLVPTEVVEDLSKIVRNYLGVKTLTEKDLQGLQGIRTTGHPDRTPFPKMVVDKITDFDAFADEWRDHFHRFSRIMQTEKLVRERLSSWPLYNQSHKVKTKDLKDGGLWVGYNTHSLSSSGANRTRFDLNIIDGVCYVLFLHIVPELRGRGYGSSLLQAVEDIAERLGCVRTQMTPSGTTSTNESRKDYLLRRGYKEFDGEVIKELGVAA